MPKNSSKTVTTERVNLTHFTADELVNAIQHATDLNSLKQLVGASNAQLEWAALRVKKIDLLCERYGEELSSMPPQIQDQYRALEREQIKFEDAFGAEY